MIDCIYNELEFTMGRRKEGMSLSRTKGFFVSLAYKFKANSWNGSIIRNSSIGIFKMISPEGNYP